MAKVRIEWVRLAQSNFSRGAAVNDAEELEGVQTLTVSSTAVLSSAAPAFADSDGEGFARVSVVSGAVNIAWGAAPTATESAGLRVESGAPALIVVTAGQFLSLIEAVDPPVTASVTPTPVSVDATSRSASITAGGTAQDLMAANASRKGWEIQNQSGSDLFVRSKGAAGTTVATADQNSLRIPVGAFYTADAHVTPNALSIIGASTGQTFYAREW